MVKYLFLLSIGMVSHEYLLASENNNTFPLQYPAQFSQPCPIIQPIIDPSFHVLQTQEEKFNAAHEIITSGNSTFTWSWTKEQQERLQQNPHLLQIHFNNHQTSLQLLPTNNQILLTLNLDEIPVHTASNRHSLKKILDTASAILAHEGAHLPDISTPGLRDQDILIRFKAAKTAEQLMHFRIARSNDINVDLSNSILIPDAENLPIESYPFITTLQNTYYHAAMTYINMLNQLYCLSSYSPLFLDHFTKTKDAMYQLALHASKLHQARELRADYAGRFSILSNEKFRPLQKAKILAATIQLIEAQCNAFHVSLEPLRSCEKLYCTHPPCTNRIEILRQALTEVILQHNL